MPGDALIHKTFEIKIAERRKDGGRIIINTAGLDRQRDRVLPIGVDANAYLNNPIVQWGHNYADPWATVGKTTRIDVSDKALTVDFELRPPANEQDPQNIVKLLWEGGWVRTASIGFIPLDGKQNDEGGYDFNKWELLEWSLVPVPANSEALRLAVKALDDGVNPVQVMNVTGTANNGTTLTLSATYPETTSVTTGTFTSPTPYPSTTTTNIEKEILIPGEPTPPADESPAPDEPKQGDQQDEMRMHLEALAMHLQALRELLEGGAPSEEEPEETPPGEDSLAEQGLSIKAGRVLSSKNERKIAQARDSLNEVLAEVQQAPESPDEGKGRVEMFTVNCPFGCGGQFNALSWGMYRCPRCGGTFEVVPDDDDLRRMFPDGLEVLAVEAGTVVKGAIPAHTTPKADPDTPWDAGAVLRELPNDRAKLRLVHAWVNPDGDPDAKQSYKLPHHLADGRVVLRGVNNAAARLPQSSIPQADHAGVSRHLERHQAQFEKAQALRDYARALDEAAAELDGESGDGHLSDQDERALVEELNQLLATVKEALK